MTKQILIELIKELKKHNLVPSKKKTEVLANLNDKRVRLLLILKEKGFITQSNLNYAIEMISKIKEIGKIDEKAIDKLWNPNIPELNNDLLKFMLHELIANFNLGMNNIQLLAKFNGYIYLPKITDILKNKKLSDLGLLEPILRNYYYVAVHQYTSDLMNTKIECINKVASDSRILKAFMEDDKISNRANYYNMLTSFHLLVNTDDNSQFEYAYGMISSLIRKNKIKGEEISDVLDAFSHLDTDFGYFESILFTTSQCKSASDIITVLKRYPEISSDVNFSSLTRKIYDKLMNVHKFSKEETDFFYQQLLECLLPGNVNSDIDMNDIYSFISKLVDHYSDFIDYYKRNNRNVDFISCALASGKDYLEDYDVIAIKSTEMSDETYDKLINSFAFKLNIDKLKAKSEIYSLDNVEEAICKNPKVLRNLNKIIDESDLTLTDGEKKLFKNPEFLRSTFFEKQYLPLTYYRLNSFSKNFAEQRGFGALRDMSSAYQNNFFYLLGTYDFEDPNLRFYMESILNKTDNPEVINSLYEERLADRENGGFASIKDSLYEVLSSSNEKLVDEYVEILAAASSNMDLNADTKVVYQKKLGKKND